VGFVMGGVALLQKRMQRLGQVVTILLVFCIAAPLSLSPMVRALPLNLTWRLMRSVMVDGRAIWELPLTDVGFVIGQTALLLAGVWAVYCRCEHAARVRGLLGQY
jgi:hypothetical protein